MKLYMVIITLALWSNCGCDLLQSRDGKSRDIMFVLHFESQRILLNLNFENFINFSNLLIKFRRKRLDKNGFAENSGPFSVRTGSETY